MAALNYRPLELPTTIRLVILEQGLHQDPINCCLLHIDRNNDQPYHALSYEWGLPSDNDPIIYVDGCRARVRKNLFDVPMQIRIEGQDHYM